MIEKMVIECRPRDNLSQLSTVTVLRFINKRYFFMGEQEIEDNSPRFYTVYAEIEEGARSPILKEDYFSNTLNPIAHKGRELLQGRKPILQTHKLDGQSLVFVFSAVPDHSP